MLSALRDAANSFIVKVFLGLLVISFAVWGVSGSLVAGPGGAAVEFGSTRVGLADYRLAYNSQLLNLSRQFGTQITGEQAKSLGVESSVLAQVVAGAVMDENARKLGLGISAKRLGQDIAADPNFKDASGVYSRQRLQQFVRSVGMTEDAYVRNRKAVAVRRQLLDGIAAGANAPEAFYSAFAAYEAEKRVLEFVEIGETTIKERPSPSDADLQKFYEINKILFVSPQYRRLALLRLSAEDLARPDDITADELAKAYEARKAQFQEAEKRRVQQLVYPDKAAAEAALARVRAGETFETILADSGKQAADVDLGLVAKSQIPDVNIAESAFKLELNATSDVVDGVFGPVLLRVIEIAPQQVKALEAVAPELRKALALDKANEDVFDAHDKIEDARAGGGTLEEAARSVGLSLRVVEAVDQSGKAPDGQAVADIPEAAKMLALAFRTDPGVEADPVPLGSSGFAWFDVLAVTPERQKPLEEVRVEATERWTRAEMANRVEALARTLRDRLAAGEEFGKIAAEALPAKADGSPATVEVTTALGRRGKDDRLGGDAIALAFSGAKGGAIVAASPAGETARLLIRVATVEEGEKKTPPEALKAQLGEAVGDDLLGALVEEFQSRDELKINRRAIETALGR